MIERILNIQFALIKIKVVLRLVNGIAENTYRKNGAQKFKIFTYLKTRSGRIPYLLLQI